MKNQKSGQNNAAEKKSWGLTKQFLRKMQLADKLKAASGRDAWSEMHRAAYGDSKGSHPRKLSMDEAIDLASRLHKSLVDFQPRLKDLKVKKSHLCKEAFGGIDSKELYRITLPPGAEPGKRGLRVTVEKYLLFIAALSKALGDNPRLIAEPILRGTRFHPLSWTGYEFSELEKIQVALQHIVNKLDGEFGWSETYRLTARLKCKGVTEGDKVCWPLYDLWPSTDTDSSAEGREAYRQEFERAADLNQAFMQRNKFYGTRRDVDISYLNGFETGVLQSDEFFFVPHTPLGHLLLWDLPPRKKDLAAYYQTVDTQVSTSQAINGDSHSIPKDEWDLAKRMPNGQTSGRGLNQALQHHFWLLAYPHPDGSSLVPTLYEPGEDGGAYILPLDLEGLEMLADAVWVSPTSHCSALDRLKQLLLEQDENGQSAIERGLRRTSGWLAENPILKRESYRQETSRRLDGLFRGC